MDDSIFLKVMSKNEEFYPDTLYRSLLLFTMFFVAVICCVSSFFMFMWLLFFRLDYKGWVDGLF